MNTMSIQVQSRHKLTVYRGYTILTIAYFKEVACDMLYAAYDPIPQPRFTRIKSCLHIPITIHKSNSHNTMLLPVPSLGNTTSSVMKRNRHTNIMVTQKIGNQSIFRAIMTETLSKIDQNVHRLNQLHARSVHIAT
ncbi:hypothetical protein AAZX31_18G255000 [Glycine max]